MALQDSFQVLLLT